MRCYSRAVLELDAQSGLFASARQVPSPNCDDRPQDCLPELIVIHAISLPPGEFGGRCIDEFFTNCLRADAHPYFREIVDLHVSSHVLIRRDGELVQYVPINRRAWHAGKSIFAGRERCNDFSVGIELEGADDIDYSDVQYEMLNEVLDALRDAYPSLRGAPVVGHSDVAPGRKTDPGPAFDWTRVASGKIAS